MMAIEETRASGKSVRWKDIKQSIVIQILAPKVKDAMEKLSL